MKVLTTRRLAVAPALALLFVAAACSDNNAGRVSFSVTSRSGVAGAASVGAVAIAPDLMAGQACAAGLLVPKPAGTTDELCITSAALILKKVELKRIETATCDAIPDNEDCDEFETGSVFVPLPLTSTQVSADIAITNAPPGMYDRLEFEIHKPDGSEAVQGFLPQGFPPGVSIRVQGTFKGNPFDYQTDLDAEQEVRLPETLDVAANMSVNVTLRVDISGWFKNSSGTALIDPNSANKDQPNESVVANNIKNSFEGFEDDDHDGLEDK